MFSNYTGGDRAAHDVLMVQIMIMFAQGMGISAIANELAISNKTVSTHKARPMEKIQFSTNVEIVKYVVSEKLIP
ncbi:hypothetical protein PEC301879_30440 [Pectobacterium carotovorum subsp. carotovorum]|nr:hypothetical protein PEC301879_30440 [Pectobacterium carotovorum subsp. carotovorum]